MTKAKDPTQLKRAKSGEGSIMLRPDGRYQIRVSRGEDAIGNKIRESTTRNTLQEARSALAEMLSRHPAITVRNRFSDKRLCYHVLGLVIRDNKCRIRLEELLLKDPYVRQLAAVNQVKSVLSELREELKNAKETNQDDAGLAGCVAGDDQAGEDRGNGFQSGSGG